MPRNERFASDSQLAAVFRGDQALGHGDRGKGVQAVQQALADLGFAMGKWASLNGREVGGPDGVYGVQTGRAVRRFRLSAGLPGDSDLDRATLEALDAAAPSPGRTAWAEGPRFPAPTPVLTVDEKPRVVRAIVVLDEGRTWLFDPQGSLRGIFPCSPAAGATPAQVGLKVVTGLYDQSVAEAEGVRLWDDPGAFGARIVDLAWWDPVARRTWAGAEMLHGASDRRSVGSEPLVGCVRHYDEDIALIWDSLGVGELVAFLGHHSDAAWPPADNPATQAAVAVWLQAG